MRSSFRKSRARALLPVFFSLCSLWVTSAVAQTVTVPTTGFEIFRKEERPSGESPYTLNRKDCLDDDASLGEDRTTIRLTPNLTGFNNNMDLEVWVGTSGTDCVEVTNRQAPNGRCSLVYSARAVRSGETIYIRPRDVVEGIRVAKAADVRNTGNRESCLAGVSQAITFHVMLLRGGNIQGSTGKWEKSPIDTLAPPPPTSLTANPGDGRLFLDWEIPLTEEATDTQGFRLYCERVESGDVEEVAVGGAGGAGSGTTSCAGAQRLIAGKLPDELQIDDLECGYAAGITSRSGQTDPLENGVTYAVAIATTDQVFNLGKLSPISCQTPEEVISFFEAYRDAGGKGGGGFCGYSPRPSSSAGLLTLLGLGSGLWLARRWRKAA